MANKTWLPLTEYSTKYKVSISTLRRRIKSGQVEYAYEDGKYLLKDASLSEHNKNPLPDGQDRRSRVASAPPQKAQGHPETGMQNEPIAPNRVKSTGLEIGSIALEEEQASPVLATANKLLNELKRAYMLILQEKEEQILQLKDELADLKTLVRVLESENDRLSVNKTEAAPIDDWLESLSSIEK